MKTAAVYDRWLYALGGGEQVAFSYAVMLRELGYVTSMLTHKHIDIKKAEEKLGVDLHGIKIVYLPPMSSIELSGETEKYDVFVNTSYLDYFPNRSKFGILSVFFPGTIFLSPYEYLKRAAIVPSFRKLFIYPTMYEGFRFDEYKQGKIYKWLGEESSIVLNSDIPNLSITLYFPTLAFSAIEQMKFFLDGKRIQPVHRQLSHTKNLMTFTFELFETKNKRFTIKMEPSVYTKEVALLKLTIHDVRYTLYNWFKKFFPKWEMRLHGGPGVTKRSDLESYDRIVTISKFSQEWIKRYWKLGSEILYPSIQWNKFKVAPKQKRIVHVGRFFVSGHNKKQLELAKAFSKLASDPAATGWELHFVGSVHEGERHQQYFEHVKAEAEGAPIVFHTHSTSDDLKELLSTSSIYWHATGLDHNEEREPIVFEHFGITTVEAMASGCVPVVINAGGQKEIVTPESGELWNTREELIEKTKALMADSDRLAKLAVGARKRAKDFDEAACLKRFKEIIK